LASNLRPAAAAKLGIPVLCEFFGEEMGKQLAADGKQADLIVGNNVYAPVPDINDFTRGLKAALKPGGTIILEFPHLMRLIENTQFDTVYHEHFSYLSLYTVERIFNAASLRVWNVEELSTHSGSLRIYGCHAEDARPTSPAVSALLAEEASGDCNPFPSIRISRPGQTGSRMTFWFFSWNKSARARKWSLTAQPPRVTHCSIMLA
jgi:hypothetical protein